MIKDVLKYLDPNACVPIDMETTTALVNALKERLAQPEQEPVAWVNKERNTITWDKLYPDMDALYTHPPQRTEQEPVCPDCKAKVLYECVACSSNNYPPQRKPLTDKAITKVIDSMPRGINGWMSDWDLYDYARAIEAKLKEKI